MTDTDTEKDPSLRKKSPEDTDWSHGEYTVDDVDTLYGFAETSTEDNGTVTVEDLGPRIDQRLVADGVDGDPHLDELSDRRINEAGAYQDAQEVQSGANAVLAEMGMGDSPESMVTQRDAMNETVAETLTEGQDTDSGRLGYENRRDARDAAIATELDRALRRGDTQPLEHLPPSVAIKVTNWLHEVGNRYGGAEFAPNDVTAEIGEYIAFAEKVSDESDGETIVRIDDRTGEAVVEATDDVVMRVIDDDPEATKLLDEASRATTQTLKDELMRREGGLYASRLNSDSQKELIDYIRRALLTSSAEQLAA